jgi:DNA-binding transcriptional LysR family regulator
MESDPNSAPGRWDAAAERGSSDVGDDGVAVESVEPNAVLDLRRVLYFVTVAQTLSYSRAAERLRLSTSGLSQQIKTLERELRVELLQRDTRHVSLTPAGSELLEWGVRMLEISRTAMTATRFAAGGEAELRVALVTGVEGPAEALLAKVQREHPTLQVVTTITKQAEAMRRLLDRSIDAAITWSYLLQRQPTPGIVWQPIYREEVLAGLSPRLAPPTGVPIARGRQALFAGPVILFERKYSPTSYDYAIENLFGDQDPSPEAVIPVPVVVRALESMAHKAVELSAIAPLNRSLTDALGGILEYRPFTPPWHMEMACAWIERGAVQMHLLPLIELTRDWARSTQANRPSHNGSRPR